MEDKATVLQVLGILMQKPQYLSEVDKYTLTPSDFRDIDKYIFAAIANLYQNGATSLQPIDIDNYLATNANAHSIFDQKHGIEYLQDAIDLSEINNFPYYYKKLKKINLLRDLQKNGFDISQFYSEELTKEAIEINKQFELLEIEDIINTIKSKLLKAESKFTHGDTTEVSDAFEGMEEILNNAEMKSDVGAPVQGDIFNEVIAGARKGTFVLRSGSSGVSKTRQAVGDACILAFPFRYENSTGRWEQIGNNKPVIFIATEQSKQEIQKMILAYLTGLNESRFRYGDFSEEENKIIAQALYLLKLYGSNFLIVRMPNPTIELVKTIVRENVLTHGIEYVFYDYIFICPSLLNEFKGFNLRNDKILSYI